MKYYIGRLAVWQDAYASASDACIVAANEAQAAELLRQRALLFIDDNSAAFDEAGDVRFSSYAALKVRPQKLIEVSAVTFEEMAEVLPVFGDRSKGNLVDESSDERVRTLARRLGTQLTKHGVKVPHGKLLHAVAASLGETDWQVLSHKQTPLPQAAVPTVEELGWPDNGQTQPFVPGTGFLWGVPVTVDTTMTAHVLVRASDKEAAMRLAREFAQEGNAKFTVDDGNYRGVADHYVPDVEEVYPLNDDGKQVPVRAELADSYERAQRGGYLVELANLGDGEDGLLWADLTIFDPSQEEPDTESCAASCPESATPDETLAFVTRVADLLYRAAPSPQDIDIIALRHAFVQAVQGDQSDEAFAAIEARLRRSVRT